MAGDDWQTMPCFPLLPWLIQHQRTMFVAKCLESIQSELNWKAIFLWCPFFGVFGAQNGYKRTPVKNSLQQEKLLFDDLSIFPRAVSAFIFVLVFPARVAARCVKPGKRS